MSDVAIKSCVKRLSTSPLPTIYRSLSAPALSHSTSNMELAASHITPGPLHSTTTPLGANSTTTPSLPVASETMGDQGHPGDSARPATSQEIDINEHMKLERTNLSARGLLTTISEKRIPIEDLELCDRGYWVSGGCGDVMVASFTPGRAPDLGRKVAVKRLKFDTNGLDNPENLLKAFVNEFQIVDGLSHPNIIKVLGFVEDTQNRVAWIVLPWEANGNVREFLLSGYWEIPERISLIKDVSSGLDYLHGQQPPICHGDLKSLNILVNSIYRAVITDFGSARVLRKNSKESNEADSQSTPAGQVGSNVDSSPKTVLSDSDMTLTLTGPTVSFRWASPELMGGKDPNLTSDVWALGWICWEIMTDNYPFPDISTLPGLVVRVVQGQLPQIREDAQLSQIRELCKVMNNCWKSGPEMRPTARACQMVLEWLPSVVPISKDGGSQIRSAALVLGLAEVYQRGSRYDEASTALNEGLAIARTTGDERTMANALRLIGALQLDLSKYDEGEECLNEALVIFKRIGDAWGEADGLRQLGHAYQAQCRYPEAEQHINQAMAIYIDLGDIWGQYGAWFALGKVYSARSKYELAEESFARALELCESVGTDADYANVFYALGGIYFARSIMETAEELYAQALAIYESIGNDLSRANALAALGDVQRATNRFEDSKRSLTEAVNVYRNLGNDISLATTLAGLGGLNESQSNLEDAETLYNQAMEIYERKDYDWGRASILCSLGRLQLTRARYSDAEGPLTTALELFTRLERERGQLITSLLLGRLRFRQARYSEAKTFIASASWIAGGLNDEGGIHQAAELLDQVFEAETKHTKLPPSELDLGHPQGPSKT